MVRYHFCGTIHIEIDKNCRHNHVSYPVWKHINIMQPLLLALFPPPPPLAPPTPICWDLQYFFTLWWAPVLVDLKYQTEGQQIYHNGSAGSVDKSASVKPELGHQGIKFTGRTCGTWACVRDITLQDASFASKYGSLTFPNPFYL